MLYTRISLRMVFAVFAVLLTQLAFASDWKMYEAKSYGYSMLVPAGVTVREQEWGGGWGRYQRQF